MSENEKEQIMRDYWLKRLSETEINSFENLWSTSDRETDMLLNVRSELIEDYLNGDLTAGDLLLFKKNFLAVPTNQRDLLIAEAFRQSIETDKVASYLTNSPIEEKSFWTFFKNFLLIPRLAIIAGALLLVASIIGVFLNIELFKIEDISKSDTPFPIVLPNSNKLENTSPYLTPSPVLPSQKPTPIKSPKNQKTTETSPIRTPIIKSTPSITPEKPMILILASILRGNESTKQLFKIPQNTITVKFQFKMRGLLEKFDRFKVKIISLNNGTIVFSNEIENLNNKQVGSDVLITIPAQKLSNGNYEFTVFGEKSDKTTEDVYISSFTIKKT